MLRLAVVMFVLLSSSPLTRTQSVCNRQAVVYVTETGTATGCCGTAQRPCGSLDLALTNANLKGATILLVNGTIPVSFSALSAPLALGGYSLTIAAGSLSSPSPTPPGKITSKPLINCKNGPCLSAVCATNGGAAGGAAPAVPCAQASVTIQGVAVMSGLNRQAGGGCLEAANQKVTLTSVDFASCIAYLNGGAVSITSSKDVTMAGVTVFDSKVTQGGIDGGGGGIAIFSSKATLSGLDIQSCHADESVGGGIAIYSTTLSLSSSSISECSSRFLGGGLASSSSTVTLKSVQITSTNGSSGGCLSDASSPSLSVQSSTFFGCFAASARDYAPYSDDPSYGGGFFLNGTVSTVVLDSTIDSTTSVYGGGGIYAMGTSSISIQRSTITRCTNYMESGTGIGVDCWSLETTGSVELIDSNILDNTGYAAVNLGVGVYLSDVNAVVRGCNISGNNGLMTEGLKAQGGGISTNLYNKVDVTFELSNSTVSNNWAYMGGGLYIASPAATISNVTFGYNYAVASGGGVYWLDGGSMSKSRVEGNVGDMGGGGMAVNTINAITLDDCDFVANEATTGEGGGVLITEGQETDVTISNSRFSQNKAMAARGGAVFHSGTALSLLSTSFQSNSAAKGGALAIVGSVLSSSSSSSTPTAPAAPAAPATPSVSTVATVTSSSFSLNHADLAGGAVYSAMTGDLRITDCQLSQNDATTGGGVALEEYSVLNMQRTVCDGNKAISGGGCLALIDSTSGVIVKGEVKRNEGGSEGGGVRASGSAKLSVSGVIIEGNSAQGGGGFVWAEMDSQVNASGTTFRNNSARFYGGVIYAVHSASVALTGSDLIANSADLGGAALIEGRAVLSSFNSSFSENAAHAVVVRGQAQAIFIGGSFNNNTAANIPSSSSSSSSASAAVSTIPTTTATATAAATATGFSDSAYPFSPSIRMAAAFAAAVTSSIESASLTTKGLTARILAAASPSAPAAAGVAGNVTAGQGGNSTAAGATAAGGAATGVASPMGDGGALHVTDSAILVINSSTLAGNTGSSGGAIFSDSLATVSINGCDFTSNSASKGAGALATGNSSLSVFLSNFSSNAASFGGGGLFYEGNSQGSILNCSFVGNDAKKGGAAVYVDRELLRKNPLGMMTDSSSGNSTGDSSSSGSDSDSSSGGSGDSGSGGGSTDLALPPAVALSNKLTCTNVVFEGNAAVPSQGVAFFDTSFWPGVRITCADADSSKRDTIGTPPTSFSLMWEKNVLEGGNGSDTSAPFTVMGDTQTPIVNITVTILDAYGNVATDDFSSTIAIQPDPRISGLLRATALRGRAVLPPVSLVLTPEDAANFTLPITVSSPTDAYPPISRELEFGLCDPGSYFSLDDLACLPCEVGFMCPAGQGAVMCEDGTFSFLPAASECATCADTVTIHGDNAMDCTNGTCTIAADFWLNPGSVYTDNPTVYYCDVSNGCAGYEYTSPNDSQCAEGYNQNRLCSMCAPGYYSVIGTCYQCTSWMETLFWFFFVLVILLWVATAVFSDRFHSVSMMNSELQILAVLGSVDLQFPDWARKVVELSTLSLFSVDILGPDCKVSFPFTSRWALTMIVAAVGLAAYALLFAVQGTLRRFFPSPAHSSHSHGHAGGKGGEEKGGGKGGEVGGDKPSANPPAPLEDIYIHGAANWLDVCYLPVTVRCFQAFSKSTYDVTVMTFSPTDLWSSSARITLFAIAIAVTIVFVAGAPIYYALTMLYGKKQKLLDTRAFRARWGWMVTRYEYRYFYWHLMLFARRILVAALFVFLIDSPPVQMTVLFPVQVILIGLQLAASPFVASTHDAFAAILIVAEMIFIIATMGYNFVQLETLPKIGFALVIVAFCVPTLLVFSYESANHLLVWKVHGAAKSLWALDDEEEGGDGAEGAGGKPGAGAASNKPAKHVREGAVEVSPSDVLDWFRPHIAAIILLPGREEERRLLMKVRRAYEACCYPLNSPAAASSLAVGGAETGNGPAASASSSSTALVPAPEFGDTSWIKDLNKSQRFAALHQIVLGAAVGRRPVARVPFDARDVPAIWTTSGGVVIAGMGVVPTTSGGGGGGTGAQESEGRDIASGGTLSSRYGYGSTSFYGGAGGGPGGASTRVHDILASSRFISKAMRENAKTDRPALVRSKNISIKNLRPPKPPQPLPQDLWPPPLEECATWAHVIGRQQAAQMERDAAVAEGREEEEEEEDEGAKEEMAGAPAGYANGGSEKPNGAVNGAANGGEANGEGEEDEEDEEEEEEEEEGEYLEAWLDSMGISLAFQQSFSQLTLVEKKRKPQSLRRLLTSVKLPDILGWLSSPLCTTADRALFVRLLAAVRAATVEDAGGPRWSKCLVVAFQGKANITRKVAAASKDYLAEASEHTLAEASQEDSPYGYGV
ncbi:unnamed protein product [Closterium sp. NIES-53]